MAVFNLLRVLFSVTLYLTKFIKKLILHFKLQVFAYILIKCHHFEAKSLPIILFKATGVVSFKYLQSGMTICAKTTMIIV